MDNQGQQKQDEPTFNEYHIYTSDDPRSRVTPALIHKLHQIKKRQYAGILSLVVIVALGGFIVYKIPEYAGDVRTRAGEAQPKPTPLFCDAKCGEGESVLCPQPLKCINGSCRNPQCSSLTSCLCKSS